jgi:hypothetical protein
MSNPPEWYDISILGAFFAYFSFFFAIFRVFHAFGCAWRLQGNKRAQEGMPALKSGMLLRFFSHFRLFFALFRDFRRFSRVWMHLEGLGKHEGVGWHVQPSKWYVMSIFLGHFSLNFCSFSRFHACFTRLDAHGRPRKTIRHRRVGPVSPTL